MYIVYHHLYRDVQGATMPVHIANPSVVAKIERLTHVTGLGKTAAVEAAVDRMLADTDPASDPWEGVDRIVAQMERLSDRADGFEAVEWDDAGLPR